MIKSYQIGMVSWRNGVIITISVNSEKKIKMVLMWHDFNCSENVTQFQVNFIILKLCGCDTILVKFLKSYHNNTILLTFRNEIVLTW